MKYPDFVIINRDGVRYYETSQEWHAAQMALRKEDQLIREEEKVPGWYYNERYLLCI